jgi:hypothetical protein
MSLCVISTRWYIFVRTESVSSDAGWQYKPVIWLQAASTYKEAQSIPTLSNMGGTTAARCARLSPEPPTA